MQAPWCKGECPPGWNQLKRQYDCPTSTRMCDGAYFGKKCGLTGEKALCERCP